MPINVRRNRYTAAPQYIYDAADNLVGMIDANGNQTSYTYNTLGALTSETDALGNSERYTYLKDGLLAGIEKPDGTTQAFTYDKSGRMIRTETSDGSEIAYAYNPLGAVTTLTDAAGESRYQYNKNGQLISYTDANDRTVNYTYDNLGRRTGITLPDGATTDYVYDSMNRITAVQDAHGTVAEYTYNANGQMTENAREGILTTYAYDALGQVETLATYKAEALLESYQYTYDANGNMLTERRETQSDTTHRTYTYDANQRLTAMREENHSEAFAYDAVGNMTQKTMNGKTTAYAYNAANQLTTETLAGETTIYTHNQNGDLIAKSTGERYTYDGRGNLTSIKGNGTDQQFTYDGAGNRISKTVDGKTTEFLNDINLPYTQVLQTYGVDSTVQSTYIYGIQRIKSEGETDEVYLYDGRGSVSGVMTDTSRFNSFAYTAYGDLLPNSPTPSAFGYNAEEMDSQTGLQYLRARYYDTKIGRFIQKDAYKGDYTNPETLNRYVYCAGNPVNNIDPSGYRTVEGASGGIVTPQDKMPSFSKVYSIKQERNSLVSQFIPQPSVAQTNIFFWNDADFFCYHWFLDKGKLEIAAKELAKIIDGLALWQIDNTTMMQTLQAILRVQDTNVTGWLDAKTVSNVENRLTAAGRDNSDPIYLSGEDIMAIYNSTDQKRSAREEWYISGGKEILTGVFILSTYVVYNKTKNFQVSGDVTSNYKEGTTRVGRWMSTDEYKKMISTNRVQESYTGTTHVAFPSNFDAYAKQAKPGSVYVEFSVPIDSVKSTGSGWAKIIGPGSLEGRYAAQNGLDIPQMPSAYDIILRGVK